MEKTTIVNICKEYANFNQVSREKLRLYKHINYTSVMC